MATVQPASAGLSVTKLWPLDRYARFVRAEHHIAATEKQTNGKWENYSQSSHPELKLSLIESNHLMVTNGNEILESILLWQTQHWFRAVAKGDSILFIYRKDGLNRRFRVKLTQATPTGPSPNEVCKDVVDSLKQLVAVEVLPIGNPSLAGLDSQTGLTSLSQCAATSSETSSGLNSSNPFDRVSQSQISGHDLLSTTDNNQMEHDTPSKDTPTNIGIKDIGQELLSCPRPLEDTLLPLGTAYGHTHFPTQQLPSFIRLCLSDPEFGHFVEMVEKEMKTLSS